MLDHVSAPLQVKFAPDGPAGEFEGYGSVFGHQDAHGDVVAPGAFAASLAQRRAEGRSLPMYANHGAAFGGDALPVGVWKSVEEDDRGLKVVGQVAAMDTDFGRRIHSLIKSGALGGLSIGFRIPEGGATRGKEAGEPRRTLKQIDLCEISVVDDPSNSLARVASIKSAALLAADRDTASAAVAQAMRLHDRAMRSNTAAPSPKDKALLMEHLRTAHHALTGAKAPDDLEGWTKSASWTSTLADFRLAASAFNPL